MYGEAQHTTGIALSRNENPGAAPSISSFDGILLCDAVCRAPTQDDSFCAVKSKHVGSGKAGLGKTLQHCAPNTHRKSEANHTDSSRAKETQPFPSVPRRCPVAGGSLALARPSGIPTPLAGIFIADSPSEFNVESPG